MTLTKVLSKELAKRRMRKTVRSLPTPDSTDAVKHTVSFLVREMTEQGLLRRIR